jgi:hypothetical protein
MIVCTVTHVTDYDLSLLVPAGHVLGVQLHCCCINKHYIHDIIATQNPVYGFYTPSTRSANIHLKNQSTSSTKSKYAHFHSG